MKKLEEIKKLCNLAEEYYRDLRCESLMKGDADGFLFGDDIIYSIYSIEEAVYECDDTNVSELWKEFFYQYGLRVHTLESLKISMLNHEKDFWNKLYELISSALDEIEGF